MTWMTATLQRHNVRITWLLSCAYLGLLTPQNNCSHIHYTHILLAESSITFGGKFWVLERGHFKTLTAHVGIKLLLLQKMTPSPPRHGIWFQNDQETLVYMVELHDDGTPVGNVDSFVCVDRENVAIKRREYRATDDKIGRTIIVLHGCVCSVCAQVGVCNWILSFWAIFLQQ